MSKKLTAVFVFIFVIFTLTTPLFTSAAVPVAKSVTLKSDNGDVKFRDGADTKLLTDGDKLWSANGKADFTQKGIVLVQNTKATTPNYYPVCNLIIDLGGEKSIDTVDVTFFHYYNAIIDTPKDGKITVSYSIDGTSFSEIKNHTMTQKASLATAGIIDEKISLGQTVKAKAVMVSMTYGNYPQTKPVNEWFGFTELSAGMAADYKNESGATSSKATSSQTSSTASSQASSSQASSSKAITSSDLSSSIVNTSSAKSITSSSTVSIIGASSAETTGGNGSNTWKYVAVGVGAAAIIAGVIYYLVKRKRNV